jgi:hypothetical protein
VARIAFGASTPLSLTDLFSVNDLLAELIFASFRFGFHEPRKHLDTRIPILDTLATETGRFLN